MPAELEQFMHETPLCDAHGPRDALQDLFTNFGAAGAAAG